MEVEDPRTLAYNNLKKWHGTLFKILPKLEFLDVTGNGHFNIMKNKLLLTDSSLKTIVGATTSKRLAKSANNPKRFMATQVLMLLFVALYLAVVGLYLHIFISARKSARGAGIRRETSLAKRICVIVFSNMIFYAVPNLCIVIFALANTRLATDRAGNVVIKC
ncbi:uncharacterized protein [Pocillopora verrucosa]|uniref:uncharacterized protein n=1 Tax=Pocillopora verrucosa TaxID=203993 RepID=UPI00333E7C70